MSRYAQSHENAAGPGDSRPTAMQVVDDEGLRGKMTDKVFFMTGASSGIGVETARALAATGATVYLAVRSPEKAREACASFLEPGRVELIEMDTSSQSSVRTAAQQFLKKSPKLNVLVCNAGVMMTPTWTETVDGHEMQLATNYLGHFLLFWLLKDAMLAASTPAFRSRLVNVSSASHNIGPIPDDWNFGSGETYVPRTRYGQTKLAQLYMANYVDRHFGPRGLHALSLMPGGILTGLMQNMPSDSLKRWEANPEAANHRKNPEQGAATTIVAALAREWEGKGGKYLEDCREAPTEPFVPFQRGRASYAYDEKKEEDLWKATVALLKLGEESG
ncbi:hypothetical protein HIM_07028 [Hirsutella minnesotensis 3608]|uniref:WW domain-containing oxidoreductase n=1 Tax=Hirsutella minnesotensis 3608 TaxID=1043627 RepID=A0A0F7ZZ23_9HYPO|nr:hypothetical protein HIM_07028 [Hirsutella minnesotensis 3608]